MKYCGGHKPSVNGRSNKRGKRGGERWEVLVFAQIQEENREWASAEGVSSGQVRKVPLQP